MSNSVSRTAAVILGSAALAAGAVLPAVAADHGHGHGHGAPAPHSTVTLGAVQYDSPGRDDRSNRSLNAEWVTVKNTGKRAVNLNGYTLAKDSRHVYHFKNVRLAAKQSLRVHTGVGRNTSRDLYQGSRFYIWDNDDTATLRDNHNHVVASKHWAPKHHR
ncbi:hypothetical protein HY68_24560 [Streptomyces sp. AcH 505]|uniref:lamin tail domain-containing protein n=1 Tax=Streptomyces sp. AcH 505 TaxID=352211 RepID=UPI000591BD1C|nr:hypothetical protein HY68_24560 [Streptomyces sp. AcH 505]